MYTALLQVTRTRRAQSFITVFLVVTVALGVFNAQAARTINDGGEDALRYSIGADIVFSEKWQTVGGEDEAEGGEIAYIEPDFGRWEELSGAASVTKVLNVKNGSMAVTGGMLRNIQVMGIHTRQFGETAWMRDDLLPNHFYEYLNAMAVNSHAVLLSPNFRSNYGYKLGDAIRYQNIAGDSVQGVVCGFVDYWPAYQPRTLTQKADGTYAESENYLIVAHLARLQDAWGVMPYEVWMDAEGSTRFVYDYAQENGVYFTSFADASEQLIRMKNDPVFQGTNGILTVGFVVVLVLCAAGFLIYWILSIRARSLQFGIYRAMGMTMKEIWGMLIGEQVLISGLSAGVGVLSGYLTAKLYMPLIQTAYTAYDNLLPLRMAGSAEDMARLALCVGAVMAVCLLILGRLIAKMNITQALKLGED